MKYTASEFRAIHGAKKKPPAKRQSKSADLSEQAEADHLPLYRLLLLALKSGALVEVDTGSPGKLGKIEVLWQGRRIEVTFKELKK